MRDQFDRWRQAIELEGLGWGLTLGGGLVMVVLTLISDPLSASAATRTTMTFAFGTAQFGLVLVMIRLFQRLYSHARRIGKGRRRD